MRLLSIRTKHYRTLQDIEIQFSKNYCTISGRNNAGKSCVIRLISALFGERPFPFPWGTESPFSYKEDQTQWIKSRSPIEIDWALEISKDADSALVSFVEKIASKAISENLATLSVSYRVTETDDVQISVSIDGEPVDQKSAKEIDKRLKASSLLFLYNSTRREEEIYYGRGRHHMFYQFVMSTEERKAIAEASGQVERRLKKLVKSHTDSLKQVLGRLVEKYEVELSPLAGR